MLIFVADFALLNLQYVDTVRRTAPVENLRPIKSDVTPYRDKLKRNTMKKRLSLLFFATLFVAFTACEKDEEKKNETPSTPQLVAPVNQSFEVADSVTFQWNPSVLVGQDRIEYTFYYSVDSINWTEQKMYNKCEFKLKNLTSNQKYYWKVTAVYTLLHSYGTVSNGEASESETYILKTYPDGVSKLKSQYSDQQIQLFWDEAPGTDYVEITFSPAVASIN